MATSIDALAAECRATLGDGHREIVGAVRDGTVPRVPIHARFTASAGRRVPD